MSERPRLARGDGPDETPFDLACAGFEGPGGRVVVASNRTRFCVATFVRQ